jgi:hypothetical protein
MDQPTPDPPPPDTPPPDTPSPDLADAPEGPADPVADDAPSEPSADDDEADRDTPAAPAADPSPTARDEQRDARIESRLQRLVGADEALVAWTQGWVSREVRLHRLLAARTLDFAVVTDRSLILCSTGFFTRRPRRRVYDSRFERIFVVDDTVARGRRRLRVTSRDAKPLWFELDASDRAATFADELTARSKAAQP